MQHKLLHPDVLSRENEVTGLWVEDGRGLWAATSQKLYFQPFGSDKIAAYNTPTGAPVTHLARLGNTLYLGTQGGGVVTFDTSSGRFGDIIKVGNNIISSIAPSSRADGILYIATDGEGVFQYSVHEGRALNHLTASADSKYRLRSNSVYSLNVDALGTLWVGYYQQGVDYTPHYGDIFEVYNAPGLIDTRGKAVRAVAVDGSRKVIGTRDGLYYIDEATGETLMFSRPEIDSNLIFCITPSPDGTHYYIGTYGGGMYMLDPARRRLEKFDNPKGELGKATVFSIEYDREGTMWVGSSEGLYRFRGRQQLLHLTSANSQLPEGNVYEIFFDSSSRGWVCTENGMAIWNGRELRSDRFPRGFIGDVKVRDIMEDSRHTLYFVPDRGAVFRSNGQLTDFGPLEGDDAGATVTTFAIEDNEGMIWLGGEGGLRRYDGKGHTRQFNNADGLPGLVFTLCKPVRDGHGDLWMGNADGLVKLDFGRFKERHDGDNGERIAITDFLANGASVSGRIGASGITLAEDENDITVYFSNFGYVRPQFQSIEYMLEGYEKVWHKSDGTKPIHYYGVSPGNYTLRMRRAGVPSAESALKITKRAGFNWMLLTIVVLILLLVTGVTAWGIHLVKLRRQRIEQAEAEAAAREAGGASGEPEHRAYRTSRVSDEECRRLLKVLEKLMHSQKPYTNPDLKNSELAAMAGTTPHVLSYLFNQYLKKSYYDYVNTYRVEEFKRMVREGDAARYTLIAMSQKCGFSSRASFFRYFKSLTGMTPAEYMKDSK